ncbi:BglII/BstYI family type II restriction endonuclease [Rhodobacter sp. KR11]|uniref:BglII/BstYI family type II restriction endonuclease n=1 Tax=Rhodobacter sp. KR11 TaxID=2974588 RepID=UPI002221C9A3|nr:BglII/BstYI family type II restriction endonuclease [Rhodobacter sp. KR11]MCW1920151.1 BglII/BstYI family type II restriction endonuclease [Rhodobacter sp. KR11]
MLMTRLPHFVRENYECHEWKHASAILSQDFQHEWSDLMDLLTVLRLRKSWIVKGGGNKSQLAVFVDEFLSDRGWREKQFQTAIEVDGYRIDSPTHKVDCFKNKVALELEWNNKDPFFDRDLNNFRLLFDLRAVSVGVILTRSDELQDIFNQLGRGSSYGMSTTHMSKLLPRIEGGGGAGCPLLVFGIRSALFVDDMGEEIEDKA